MNLNTQKTKWRKVHSSKGFFIQLGKISLCWFYFSCLEISNLLRSIHSSIPISIAFIIKCVLLLPRYNNMIQYWHNMMLHQIYHSLEPLWKSNHHRQHGIVEMLTLYWDSVFDPLCLHAYAKTCKLAISSFGGHFLIFLLGSNT